MSEAVLLLSGFHKDNSTMSLEKVLCHSALNCTLVTRSPIFLIPFSIPQLFIYTDILVCLSHMEELVH
jgi:hypothetical protein